ncbi:hypothetical protein ELH26_37265 [Rhizobium leguminosarum]|nr:hypothetical protein ELH26_37265 [Rhizobium leguminosarum]
MGLKTGTFEAEPIWTEFLRKLTRRGSRCVKLVVSDAHESIKTAVRKVLIATWQHGRVHFHEESSGACGRERAAPRFRLHRHGVCPGDAGGC